MNLANFCTIVGLPNGVLEDCSLLGCRALSLGY